jgi:hypothetical protein
MPAVPKEITALLGILKVQAPEGKTLKSKLLNFRPLQRMKRLSEIPLRLALVNQVTILAERLYIFSVA